MRAKRVKLIRALDRGLEVLGILQSVRASTLHELHTATRLPKATLTRIMLTLERRGLIWQRIADNAYLASYTLHERARHLDDTVHLVEIASPVLDALCKRVAWPSILAVPRLSYMEVIETNVPHSYFHHIPLGPVGFKVNMLRSAAGRAYLAFCSESERSAVFARLKASTRPGDRSIRDRARIERILEVTRKRGYAIRDEEFGGHFELTRREFDDGRNSIGVPIQVDTHVFGALNLTWTRKVCDVREIVTKHLPDLTAAAAEISRRMER